MTEIYLTKMILNPQSRASLAMIWEIRRNCIRRFQRRFRQVENQRHLPHHERKTPRNKFNILHRLDFDASADRAVLLVQSALNPDWSFLPDDYADEIECKTIHEQYGRIENGINFDVSSAGKSDEAHRQIRPNRHERFQGKRKIRRRVELRTDEEKIEWLKRKGEDAGFQLADVKIKECGRQCRSDHGRKNRSSAKTRKISKMTFGSVVFEGVLEVTDAEKFRESLRSGIGTGKAYGFGFCPSRICRRVENDVSRLPFSDYSDYQPSNLRRSRRNSR